MYTVHYTRDVHKRLCTQCWEDMGAFVKLEEWTLVVVGLADNVGLALAGCVKAVLQNE